TCRQAEVAVDDRAVAGGIDRERLVNGELPAAGLDASTVESDVTKIFVEVIQIDDAVGVERQVRAGVLVGVEPARFRRSSCAAADHERTGESVDAGGFVELNE